MRAFPVQLPSGLRYWTVLDDELTVVPTADAFLRHVRFGRDGAELTTRAYAGGIALYLRWCARTGRDWRAGAEELGLFITWLRHAGEQASGAGPTRGGQVLAGPGAQPARGPRRVNAVLSAVRGFLAHAVTAGDAPEHLLPMIYELADARDLPTEVRGEDSGMTWRLRARHRLHEPAVPVARVSDEAIVALLGACLSCRDRLLVLLMARAGLRRGEMCGLRRSDVHLLPDSRMLGCPVQRAHLHVVRRENLNGAWAKSRRQRTVPLDFLVVQALDAYAHERAGADGAQGGDFLLVNLFRGPIGAPMRPDAINEIIAALSDRAGLAEPATPHQLRHAFVISPALAA
jgi:integrase